MKVKEIMTENAKVIQPGTTIKEAAGIMRDMDVGVLPIADGDNISGILTDRDIVIRAVAEGKDPSEVKAGETASNDITWCYEDEDVEEVSGKMKKHKIRRLPVVDREEKLVGIVSLGDLAVQSSEEMAGETLEEISTPNRPER